jgi:phenylacetate-CoA ligase
MLSDRPEHPALPGYPVVERIEGRLQEFLVCRDHRLVSITTMGAAHFDELAEVDAIQYEQHEPGHFVLNVVSRHPLDEKARRSIAHAVEVKTQSGCTAEIRTVGEIPRTERGKHRMLLQHLDVSDYMGATAAE